MHPWTIIILQESRILKNYISGTFPFQLWQQAIHGRNSKQPTFLIAAKILESQAFLSRFSHYYEYENNGRNSIHAKWKGCWFSSGKYPNQQFVYRFPDFHFSLKRAAKGENPGWSFRNFLMRAFSSRGKGTFFSWTPCSLLCFIGETLWEWKARASNRKDCLERNEITQLNWN